MNNKTLLFIFTTAWSHTLSDFNVHQKPSDHKYLSTLINVKINVT